MKRSEDEEEESLKTEYNEKDIREEEDQFDRFRGISWILFVVYLLALTWIAVFKMTFPISMQEGERMFNLIPFQGTVRLLGHIPLAEWILQGLLFIPFGIYMSMLKSHLPAFVRLLPAIGASLVIEAVEILLNTGAFDVTDICMNIAGAIGGIIIEYVIFRTFPRHYEKILLISMAVFSVVLMMIVATGLT